MTNQALLYANMQGQGMGHLLPEASEYGRQAAEKKKKAEKWAARASGVLFGGAMLIWGRSSVTFKDPATGLTVPADKATVNELVLGVLAQNDSIQTSQIARETIKPLFEDVCGWIAGLFYPDDEEAALTHRMLSQPRTQMQPQALPPHPAAAPAAPAVVGGAAPAGPLPWKIGSLLQEKGNPAVYRATAADGSDNGIPVMLRHVSSPATGVKFWGPQWAHAIVSVAPGALASAPKGPEI